MLADDSDVAMAAGWCVKALLNQYMYFPRIGTCRRTYFTAYSTDKCRIDIPIGAGGLHGVQGMFRGIRAINFIKTILNIGYMAMSMKYVRNKYSL